MTNSETSASLSVMPGGRDCCCGMTAAGLLKIAETYRVAVTMPLLVLATIGCLLTPLGWRMAGALLLPDAEEGVLAADWQSDADLMQSWPGQRPTTVIWGPGLEQPVQLARPLVSGEPSIAASSPAAAAERSAGGESTPATTPRTRTLKLPEDPAVRVPYRLAKPFWRIFDRGLTWRVWLFFATGAVWTLFVWSWIGGAICRMATLRLGRDERAGFRESLMFAKSKWLEFAVGPLLPVLGILLMSVPMVVLGLLMRTDWGLLVGGLLFFLVLVGGLLMAGLGLILMAAWPLMWGVIASEGSDSFDAISRSYAYVMQRPFSWAAYVACGLVVGMLGWVVTTLLCESIIGASLWGLSVGMGDPRATDVSEMLVGNLPATGVAAGGVWIMALLIGLVRLVASAVAYGHFWCLATVWYLLLRDDVDQMPWSEIYLEDEDEPQFGLPPVEPPVSVERGGTEPVAGSG